MDIPHQGKDVSTSHLLRVTVITKMSWGLVNAFPIPINIDTIFLFSLVDRKEYIY